MLGKLCGPVILSFLYSLGGIFLTYLISSIATFIVTIFIFGIEFGENVEEKEKDHKISYNFISNLFKVEVMILFIVQIINMATKSYYAPTFTDHVMNKFQVSLETAASIQSFSYISYYFTFKNFDFLLEKLEIKLLLVISFILSFLISIFLGPISILPQ